MSEKNKKSWNDYSDQYASFCHSDKMLNPIINDPAKAFHQTTWEQIQKYMPEIKGKKICVPSSGDNHAVFAFALMGAEVTSCDISEKQLEHAQKVAERLGVDKTIEFICADTMKLDGIKDNEYDFVYTSNGVHVWIDDLNGMYKNIHRIMKPDSIYMMYEIHPFLRPFDDAVKVIKPYDMTGPFDDGTETTYAWRVQDFLNAIIDSGIKIEHIEEMYAEKDYNWPFWISAEEIINNGATATREEVDRMHDWKNNPMAALPNWLCVVGRK